MTTRKLSSLAALALLALVLAAPSALLAQPTRTDWQMHRGQGVLDLPQALASHGDVAAYALAEIPLEGDPGWTVAPNKDTIGFQESSFIPGGKCMRAVDYTYFQTFVTVPPNTAVKQFSIEFSGMDDGSRISINGVVDPESYVRLNESSTKNLANKISTGRNRIVITQVDDCAVLNNLKSAIVKLNGSPVVVQPPPPACHDASAQFSLSSNPNGEWTYGWSTTPGGTLTTFSKSATGPLEPGAGAVSYWNTGAPSWDAYHSVFSNQTATPSTVSQGLVVEPWTLVLHPANDGKLAVARFTARSDGQYSVWAGFKNLDAQAKKTQALVARGGVTVHQQILTGANASSTNSWTFTLRSGETIDFAVGNGGDGFGDDSVQLAATVVRTGVPAAP